MMIITTHINKKLTPECISSQHYLQKPDYLDYQTPLYGPQPNTRQLVFSDLITFFLITEFIRPLASNWPYSSTVSGWVGK
jgi:hypothetical protein